MRTIQSSQLVKKRKNEQKRSVSKAKRQFRLRLSTKSETANPHSLTERRRPCA
jgi:hypothetical protein